MELQLDLSCGRLGSGVILADVQHIAGAQHAARLTAEFAQDESGAAAQIQRSIEAAGHREIGACSGALRAPEFEHRIRLDAESACHCGIGWPSSRAPKSAPVSAIVVSQAKRNVGPVTVNSSPAAFSALPTRRLAKRKASESIGPEGGTPTCQ